jgi:hypothetical protein
MPRSIGEEQSNIQTVQVSKKSATPFALPVTPCLFCRVMPLLGQMVL